MTVIFVLSHEPAIESSARSGEIVEAVQPYLWFLSIDNMTNIVRKSAHVVAYFTLGTLAYNLVRTYNLDRYKMIVTSVLIALLYAISDEIHQTFIPGRSGEIADVLIDTIAASVGVFAHYYIAKIRSARLAIKHAEK